MSIQTEYFISKLSFREDRKLIHEVLVHEYDGRTLSEGLVVERKFLVDKKNNGSKLSILTKGNEGVWVRGNEFIYENGIFRWGMKLPLNISRRKTFVSFYHHDDQSYREKFKELFDDLVISKSVEYDDIDPDNSDAYIKQLIQKDFLSDTTVLVVLLGPKTKCRKHIDWEISGGLNLRVGDRYAGLLGLKLPSHPDFGTGHHTYSNLPERLAANLKSGYARIDDWTDDRAKLQSLIEDVYERRLKESLVINKEIPQLLNNLCD